MYIAVWQSLHWFILQSYIHCAPGPKATEPFMSVLKFILTEVSKDFRQAMLRKQLDSTISQSPTAFEELRSHFPILNVISAQFRDPRLIVFDPTRIPANAADSSPSVALLWQSPLVPGCPFLQVVRVGKVLIHQVCRYSVANNAAVFQSKDSRMIC